MSVNITKQGLVNASGKEIGTNIVINSTFANTYQQTTGWDTSKNGTTLASSWGVYNSGVSNPSTVCHAHMKQFQGEWVYEYIRTSAESWLGIAQGGIQALILPNTTYTWSMDEYRPSGSNNYTTSGIYYKRNSSDSYGFHSGCPRGTYEDVYDKWVRKYYTFTTGDVYNSVNISLYIYGHGGLGTVYLRRPKLEKGSVATPWSPAVSEGNDATYHGFVESITEPTKIYKDYVQMRDFIEI